MRVADFAATLAVNRMINYRSIEKVPFARKLLYTLRHANTMLEVVCVRCRMQVNWSIAMAAAFGYVGMMFATFKGAYWVLPLHPR